MTGGRERAFSNPLCWPILTGGKGKAAAALRSVKVQPGLNALIVLEGGAQRVYVQQGVLPLRLGALLFLFHDEHSVHGYPHVLQRPASCHFQRLSGKGGREAVESRVVADVHHPVQ